MIRSAEIFSLVSAVHAPTVVNGLSTRMKFIAQKHLSSKSVAVYKRQLQ